MHFDALSEPEQRVFGCLIEKRFTTPDQYPLTLNSLRLACNQSTNRDPVVSYDETTVREAVQRLAKYGLTRLASGHSSRAIKYRHLAEDALAVNREQLAVLAVLLLRGEQTPGELKGRTERIVNWESLEAVDAVIEQLVEREYVVRVGRRPGQKEDRYAHLLGGAAPAGAALVTDNAGAGADHSSSIAAASGEREAAALRLRVADLEAEVMALRLQLADTGSGAATSGEPGEAATLSR